MGSGDLGAPAYRKYDVEAWMPGLGRYGEVRKMLITERHDSSLIVLSSIFHLNFLTEDLCFTNRSLVHQIVQTIRVEG